MEATAQLVSRHGYQRLRVADIARVAGVSRSTIYELFADKEEAFLACYQIGSDEHRRRVEAALSASGHPEDRLRAAISAYLGVLDDDATAARAYLLEPQRASSRVRERFHANQAGYLDLFEAWHVDWRTRRGAGEPVPGVIWSAVLSGIVGLVSEHLERGEGRPAADLTEACVDLVLSVATGPRA